MLSQLLCTLVTQQWEVLVSFQFSPHARYYKKANVLTAKFSFVKLSTFQNLCKATNTHTINCKNMKAFYWHLISSKNTQFSLNLNNASKPKPYVIPYCIRVLLQNKKFMPSKKKFHSITRGIIVLFHTRLNSFYFEL